MKPTASNLIRWSGLSAMAAGIIFIGIQPIHPPDVLSSVTTSAWAIVTSFKTAMALFGLLGLAGLYARQAEKAGWLGLAGYLLFSIFFALTTAFAFAEAFFLPLLATDAPKFVEGILGLASGSASPISLGPVSTIYALLGAGYMLGSLLFGIATFRARLLPRWAAVLLALSGPLAAVMTTLLPHPLDRMAAVPMGLALAWLGYGLLSERRAKATEPGLSMVNPQLSQTGAQ